MILNKALFSFHKDKPEKKNNIDQKPQMITRNISFSPPPKLSELNKGIAANGMTKNIIRIALFIINKPVDFSWDHLVFCYRVHYTSTLKPRSISHAA